MRGALYQCFVQVQELVLLPVQGSTSMRALIVVSKEFTIFMHHKNRPGFVFNSDLETFTAGVFNVGSFAENICHNV